MKGGAEAPDSSGITTVKEYKYVAAAKLPRSKGISSYTPMADRTGAVRDQRLGGWSPIIYANNGFKPGKVWKTPAARIQARARADRRPDRDARRLRRRQSPRRLGHARHDPLFLEGLAQGFRASCRASSSRSTGRTAATASSSGTPIKTMADLRGKTIVLAQNSPSHFFVLNALINAACSPPRSSSSSRRTRSGGGRRSTPTSGWLPS
jgi:hypothetical protein